MPYVIGEHAAQLERLLRRTENIGLVTIDPLSAFFGKTDSWKDAEVRAAHALLATLAAKYGVAVVAVTHLKKGADGKAIHRSMGSLGIPAAARAVWMVTRERDSERRLFLNAGMNLCRDPGGLAYTVGLNPEIDHPEENSPYVTLFWETQRVDMDADEALAAENDGGERQTALDQAMEFVREKLRAAPLLAKELDAAASAVGISTTTLKRAKAKVGVTATQQRAAGKVTGWILSLGQSPVALTKVVDPLGIVDPLGALDGRGQERGVQGDQGDQGLLGGPAGELSGNGQPAANQEGRP